MSLLASYYEKTTENSRSLAAIAYLASLDHIAASSPQIAKTILKELQDQRSNIKLIASENYSSLAVQLAMGNLLTDKYAEGVPHRRFYAGCENIDTLEELAQNELKALFGAQHAYVQPHSGADANLVAFWTLLIYRVQSPMLLRLGKKSVDQLSAKEYEQVRQAMLNLKVMGMSLNSGGHLTHGYRHNLSSKMMRSVPYEVDSKTEQIDYSALAEQVDKERPDILLAGYSSYPRRLNFALLRQIADAVGATLMVDMAHFAGLVAGKAFVGEFDPIPYADIVTSTTHKTLRGPRGGFVLCKKELAELVDKGCPLVLGGPLPHVIAAKALAFQEASRPDFRLYAHAIIANAKYLARQLQQRGLRLVTGDTENHLVVIDLTALGLTGRHGEKALRQAGLTANRNAIPFDAKGPWYTSGLRLGTPAVTTLGMREKEMEEIADIIATVLFHTRPINESLTHAETDVAVVEKARQRVAALLQYFPLYPEIAI